MDFLIQRVIIVIIKNPFFTRISKLLGTLMNLLKAYFWNFAPTLVESPPLRCDHSSCWQSTKILATTRKAKFSSGITFFTLIFSCIDFVVSLWSTEGFIRRIGVELHLSSLILLAVTQAVHANQYIYAKAFRNFCFLVLIIILLLSGILLSCKNIVILCTN